MKLVSIPANPVPEGAVAGTLTTPDGVKLRFARWPPPPRRKGTVCVFLGRVEFIEKYFEVVRNLHARGLAVAVLEWRGQGLSERALRNPAKGHVGSFSEYGVDLETFMREIVLPDCPPPLFALAHSMGATVLIQAAAKGYRWFDRMVMSAPMLRLSPNYVGRFARPVTRILRLAGTGHNFVPGGSATILATQPFVGNDFTSDPVRHARTAAILEEEPALGIGSPTVAWADAAFRAMAEVSTPAFASRLRQPMLIAAAGRDRLISSLAIENFSIHLRAGSHLVIAGAQHELLMEQDHYRSQFFAAFDAFVPGTPLRV
jgi:lysophospholipase